MDALRLADHFTALEPWTPRLVAELNGQHVRLARLEGAFSWHAHAEADELFLVLEGAFDLELRDRIVTLRTGELFVVPRGVEHRPVAHEPCVVLLFEPAEVQTAGDSDDPRGLGREGIRPLR
ncbi:MAG: cupin domain-containing protein [Planctomycetota bacterium]|nr:cupin domain-containing protein [Planctomycetota bacterium]